MKVLINSLYREPVASEQNRGYIYSFDGKVSVFLWNKKNDEVAKKISKI